MEHQSSFWEEINTPIDYPSLNEDKHVEVCIIGGGLTGLSTAYYLSKTLKNVMLVDANKIGQGASGRSTGKVSSLHGCIYHSLISIHGKDKAYAYYEANEEAIHSIEAIIKENSIECNYRRGKAITYAETVEKTAMIADEIEALEALDIPFEIMRQEQFPHCLFGVCFNRQGMFDPYAYALGLSRACVKQGVIIYENSPLTEMDGHDLIINHHCVHADTIIYATQVPLFNAKHFYFTLMTPYQSSLCVIKTEHEIDEMFINCESPTKTSRTLPHNHEAYLMVGGYEHKTGDNHTTYETELLRFIENQYPNQPVLSCFSSQDLKTHDHLPLIGMLGDDPNILFATGYNKWGNTNSNIAGKLLTAMVLKAPTPLKGLFDPHRSTLVFNQQFLKENLAVGVSWIQSKMMQADQPLPGINEATTLLISNHPYGVYRNEQGELLYVDLICPHLGCTLSFNESEKTWDCPCHGSRFDVTGEIIKGPAIRHLNDCHEVFNKVDPKL